MSEPIDHSKHYDDTDRNQPMERSVAGKIRSTDPVEFIDQSAQQAASIDTGELRKLAEHANAEEWEAGHDKAGNWYVNVQREGGMIAFDVAHICETNGFGEYEARFIAAANPAAILRLLNGLDMVRSLYEGAHADRMALAAATPAQPIADVSAPTVENLMTDMDTMRDEFHSLSRALSFWLPCVPVEAGPIQDRVVHDAYFLTDGPADDKCAEELGWITLNKALPSAPLSNDTLELLNSLHGKASIPTDWPQPFAGTIVLLETLAEIGMTAKRDGQPTANSRLCVRFAADLRDFLAARAAAPVSGQGAPIDGYQHDSYSPEHIAAVLGISELPPLPEMDGPYEMQGALETPPEWDADYREVWQKLQVAERNKMQWRAHALQLRALADSRPRSEDSRAEVLGAVENIVLQQCTGMAAKDIRLSRILDAIRALATTAAPERSGQAERAATQPAGDLRAARAAMARAKQLPVWDNINHALHVELDIIFKALAAPISEASATDIDHEATAELHAILAQYPPESWAVRNQAFDEAAQIADGIYQESTSRYATGRKLASFRIAKAIRSLKTGVQQTAKAEQADSSSAAPSDDELVKAWFAANNKYIVAADFDAWLEQAYRDGLRDARLAAPSPTGESLTPLSQSMKLDLTDMHTKLVERMDYWMCRALNSAKPSLVERQGHILDEAWTSARALGSIADDTGFMRVFDDLFGETSPSKWHEVRANIIAWIDCRVKAAVDRAALATHRQTEGGGVPLPDDDAIDSALHDAMAEQLGDLYSCGRVWHAWQVGTMTEDDFSIASEDDDIVYNFVSAAREAFKTLLAASPAPTGASK